MRGRLLVLALLVAPLPALAGCMQDESEYPLMQPTDEPALVPRNETPEETGPPPPDFDDPGYVMEGAWQVGDGWDYESNRSKFHRVRVVDTREVNNRTDYLIEERFGPVGGNVRSRTLSWVTGDAWLRVEMIDQFDGGRTHYAPGEPLRLYRNATFGFNATFGADTTRVYGTSRYVGQETLLFPWGYVQAGKVEHRLLTLHPGGSQTRLMVTRWAHEDYLWDVGYRIGTEETFTLVAAQVGDFRRGKLAGT